MHTPRPVSKQPIPDTATKVFTGALFDVYQWQQQQYDGTFKTFEKLKRPDTVLILPICDDGRIILAQQEQPGGQPFIGTLGGRIEEGEDILEAAKRELLEESGYVADEFVLWKAEHPFAKMDWVIYTFIAKGMKKVANQNLDSGEKISLLFVTFEELLDLVKQRKLRDRDIILEIFEALADPEKKETLRELFSVK